MICSTASAADGHQLLKRHFSRIVSRTSANHTALCQVFAIAFRPGDRSDNFVGKAIRPIGQAVMSVLSYGCTATGRATMPLFGFKASADQFGFTTYGPEGSLFRYDGRLKPCRGARGRALDGFRNPTLTDQLQRMDQCCSKQLGYINHLPIIPRLPRILLGFAPTELPTFEDTPALRRLAARQIGMPVERLGGNGDVLLDRLLQDVWHEQLIPANALGNSTGLLLIDADLCNQARRSLRTYEDFGPLLGVATWNPARSVSPVLVANPAREVLTQFEIDEKDDFSQYISDDTLQAMQLAMRQKLGDVGQWFSTEEVLDALTAPNEPAKSWSAVLTQLRANLSPYYAECSTDDDLLRAARCLDGPLIASGACKIQALQRRTSNDSEAFHFSAEELGHRVEAELGVGNWSNRFEQVSELPAGTRLAVV